MEISRLLLVLFIATFATFAMLYTESDTVAEDILVMQDLIPTKEAIEGIKKEYGLDKPFVLQYANWIQGVTKGELGYSHSLDKPVLDEFVHRLPNTLILTGYSTAFILIFSLLFGLLGAMHKNKFIDKIIALFSSFAIAMPAFWIGLILIVIFIVKLRFFELTNMNNPKNMLLPAISLALPLIGRYAMLIRASMLDQVSANYVTSARTRGIPQRNIILRHILPNAIVSILPLLGISIGAILGGTVIIETVFGIHGIGSMVISGINHSDYPLIQSFVLFMTTVYIAISFAVDWLCKLIDPRLRHKNSTRIEI